MMLKSDREYSLIDINETYQSVNKKVNQLLLLIFLVFISAIFVQNERFDFREDALSSLGNIYPGSDNNNLAGFIIFVSGMLLAAFICFGISNDLKVTGGHFILKITGIGFVLLAIPSNQVNLLHSLGGALTIGSLWWFGTKNLVILYRQTTKFKFMLYEIMLQGTVLPYAILYFAGLPVRQAAQKFAVLGLILILKLTILGYLRVTGKKRNAISQ